MGRPDQGLLWMPKAFSDFTEMIVVDYNLLKKELAGENGKEVTLEGYLLGIRDAGKFKGFKMEGVDEND